MQLLSPRLTQTQRWRPWNRRSVRLLRPLVVHVVHATQISTRVVRAAEV